MATQSGNMEKMVDAFGRLWRSERLVFKAFDENEQCRKCMYKVFADQVVSGLGDFRMPKPRSKAECDKIVTDMKNGLVSVLVCIPKEKQKQQKTGDNGDSKQTKDGKGKDTAEEEEEDEAIGFVQLNQTIPGTAMISLSLVSSAHNKGYGRECINWILDYGFRWANLHRISIGTASYNERALHLYKDIGFVFEGRTREGFYMDLQWHDIVEFGMLFTEWKALRKL